MFRRILLLLIVLSAGHGIAGAAWNKVFQNPRDNTLFGCSFFLTGNYGFIGEGAYSYEVEDPAIFRTVNGGSTWIKGNSPKLSGHISSIFMTDSLNGYASVHSVSFLQSVLWKTTDGGVSWYDVPQSSAIPLSHANCVYPAANGIVLTAWDYNGIAAGVSFDQGATYTKIFTTSATGNLSNGIAFSTPQIGIVSLRYAGGIAECWSTVDGGSTWSKGDNLEEAWSIYAIKGTNIFYALPEGEKGYYNKELYFTTDVGKKWNKVTNNSSSIFTNLRFTGHIDGFKNTLYIQTEDISATVDKGLYRSDNLGTTWKSIGGPSNERDTRFSVTGCNGEVVYAFDNQGGLWKTDDGGDGTVFGGDPLLPALSLVYDSLGLTSHYCESVTFGFPLINGSCSELILDSILITDPSGKFTLLDSLHTVLNSHTDSLRFHFQSDSNETQTITIHLKGKGNGKTIDTILRATVTNISNGVFGPVLSLQSANAKIRTHYCQPGEVTIPIHNVNCSTLKIDTLYLVDTLNESSITYRPKHDSIPIFSTDSIKLSFQTNTNESRTIPVHLKCTIAGRSFDTVVILDVFHSRSPEPYLGQPKATKVGDTVLVPVYILPPTDSINIKHLAFHLSYNGDLLTPVAGKTFETNGTLCQHNKNLSGSEVSLGNLDCSIDLENDSIYNLSDFTKPVIYVRFRVTLTTELSCPIFIDSFSIIGRTPLGLCDIPSTTFQLDPRCGDSTIWRFMRTGKIPQIISMHPNPAADKIEIEFEPAGRSSAQLQIVSALGITIKEIPLSSQPILSQPINRFSVETSALPSGIYYARIVTNDGAICSKAFSVEH